MPTLLTMQDLAVVAFPKYLAAARLMLLLVVAVVAVISGLAMTLDAMTPGSPMRRTGHWQADGPE